MDGVSGPIYLTYSAYLNFEQIGDDDFLCVFSHNLRRYWVDKMLNEYNINQRIVMETGGWSSFNSMKSYMKSTTPNHH